MLKSLPGILLWLPAPSFYYQVESLFSYSKELGFLPFPSRLVASIL